MRTDVPRDLDSLAEVMRLVERFFESTTADPRARYPVELALEEVFTNLVKYNPEGRDPIRVDLSMTDGELIISITDFDAPRFDLSTDAPPVDVDVPLEERKPGGLGIYLVKKMMDRIEYSHENRTGTITLHKRVN